MAQTLTSSRALPIQENCLIRESTIPVYVALCYIFLACVAEKMSAPSHILQGQALPTTSSALAMPVSSSARPPRQKPCHPPSPSRLVAARILSGRRIATHPNCPSASLQPSPPIKRGTALLAMHKLARRSFPLFCLKCRNFQIWTSPPAGPILKYCVGSRRKLVVHYWVKSTSPYFIPSAQWITIPPELKSPKSKPVHIQQLLTTA